jgi:hypothetical protein
VGPSDTVKGNKYMSDERQNYISGIHEGLRLAMLELYALKDELKLLYTGKELEIMFYSLDRLHDEIGIKIFKHYRPLARGF